MARQLPRTRPRAAVLLTSLLGAAAMAATTAATAQVDVTVAELLAEVGFPAELANELADGSLQDGTGDTFRYAAEGSRPATLTDAYVDIQTLGGVEAIWPDPPVLTCGPTQGGPLVVCGATPPDLSEPHALMWMEMGGPIPLDPGLESNIAFPVLTPGGSPWVAQDAFPWDTFQGADRWHQIVQNDGSWGMLVQYYDGSTVEFEDTSSWAMLWGDSVLMGVPRREILAHLEPAPPPGEPMIWVFAGAIHVHDGTFGRTPDDISGVDSHPDTDSGSPRGPGGMAAPIGDPVTVAPAPATDEPSETPSTGEPTETASPEPTTTPTETDDGGGLPWIPIILGGLVILIGGGVILTGTRERPKDGGPGTTTKGGDGEGGDGTKGGGGLSTTTRDPETPPCDCTITVTVDGPNDLGRCCFGASSYALHPVLDTNAETDVADPSKIHVDGNDDDGHDAVDAIYSATVTAECSGGGEARIADATYDWSVTANDNGFTLTVDVHVPVHCPGGQEHPGISQTATYEVTYHPAPCIIGVMVEQVAWNEISHVDIQIICGEFNKIYGYFPEGARSFGNTIGGAPGDVLSSTSSLVGKTRDGSMTTGISDEIGSEYAASHSSKSLKIFWIEPEDCEVCRKLRDFWENLDQNPGTYYLLGNNCASMVWKSLLDSGALTGLDPRQGPGTPSGVEGQLNAMHELGNPEITDVSSIR